MQNQVEQKGLPFARRACDADYEHRTVFDVITEKYLFPFCGFEIAILFRKEGGSIHYILKALNKFKLHFRKLHNEKSFATTIDMNQIYNLDSNPHSKIFWSPFNKI